MTYKVIHVEFYFVCCESEKYISEWTKEGEKLLGY